MNSSEITKPNRVIFIDQKPRDRWLRTAAVYAFVIALWSMGRFVGSPALEWIGVVIALVVLAATLMAKAWNAQKNSMTPAEAREWLRREFDV